MEVQNKEFSEGEENLYTEGTQNPEDIHGITDTVTEYTYTEFTYPCFIINKGFSCPKHKLRVISGMVSSATEDKDIAIYYESNNEMCKIGSIDGSQVMSFIDVVGEENISGYYDSNTKLENSSLYTLAVM